jgi:hypothetical protein
MTSTATLKTIDQKAVSMKNIRSLLETSPSRQKLLFLDTCQSYVDSKGEVNGGKGKKGDNQKKTVVQLKNGGRLIFAGARSVKGFETTLALTKKTSEISELFPELRRGTGTIEISAAINGQAALEGIELADKKVLENGVFTYAIKEALAKGSKVRDKDGRISAKALRSYVLKRVEELTTDVDGRVHQSPMVARDIAGRDWVVIE